MHGTAYGGPMRGTETDGNPVLGTEQLAYRVQTAARLLDLSERVVWELIRTGQIESHKIGAARLIPRAALQRFIDGLGSAA